MLAFVAVKYLSLGLNASRSLVLASLLGPQSFGVLGTLVVVQQYLSYAALGMREGLTVMLARDGVDPPAVLRSTALAWALAVGLLIVAGGVLFDQVVRPLDAAWLWVGVISLLSICNEILINIHRDLNRLMKVALLEALYNLSPLACAVILGNRVTVVAVLQSIAFGLALSVAGYLMGLAGLGWRLVSLQACRRLIGTGIPMAVSAFFSASVTSIYVLIANAMHLGAAVGLVAFANSACSIVLFGSNMVAWAATSKSMRQLAGAPMDGDTVRNQRLTYFFRVAALASSTLIGASGPLVARFLPAYAGMEHYALLFCLLQATALMLYVELNFMAVTHRAMIVAAGYGTMLAATLLLYALVPTVDITGLVNAGIVLSMLLGLGCAVFCHRAGLRSVTLRSQVVFLAFPVLAAVACASLGPGVAAAVAAAFLARALFTGWRVFSLKVAA